MSDIIQLLPDSIANQIAAGEVVQRPASVVKELMENAIDAQCTSIQLIVKDGGKSLVQVIDNGVGMSETDARMSFERHATSKIRQANDLFALRTMGFRGEALASIAAVAEVELRTRKHDSEIGSHLQISGSNVVSQQATTCTAGTNIEVNNLYFNTPARRKFLKSDSVELKHIITEFQRVALAYPEIEVSLTHNGIDLYRLQGSNLKQRIVGLFGKHINQHLIECGTRNTIVNIEGFVGKPESAKKGAGEQFFFVNGRFMRNPFLHRAVMNAYSRLIPDGTIPTYFLFLDIDPASIDVNIHPTKTEIKFEDERTVWQIVHASVRESLGKFTLAPQIDFDNQVDFEIPYFSKNASASAPRVDINPTFNPFEEEGRSFASGGSTEAVQHTHPLSPDMHQSSNGQLSIQTFKSKGFGGSEPEPAMRFFNVKGRYILTTIKSGVLVIHQQRAHVRILFDKFIGEVDKMPSQKELYPRTIELKPHDHSVIIDNIDILSQFGMEISDLGHNTVSVSSLPANLKFAEPAKLIDDLVLMLTDEYVDFTQSIREKIALSLAKAAAIGYSKSMGNLEMQDFVDSLFACKLPSITPDGKQIITTIEMDELDRRFK